MISFRKSSDKSREQGESDLFFSLKQIEDISGSLEFNRVFYPRLLLELHKYSFSEVNANMELVRREAQVLLAYLRTIHAQERPDIELATATDTLHSTQIENVPELLAKKIHSCYHYLLTPRSSMFHLGLFSSAGRLLGLASFSNNDLSHLNGALPQGIHQTNSLILSRFVTFEHSPFNTATYLLSQTSKWLRDHNPETKLVLTYFDPNLKFGGAIYKAFNAALVAREAKKRYLYYNGLYVSDRFMIEKFGTADFEKLRKLEPYITKSKNELKPLEIYGWYVNNKKRLETPTLIQTVPLNTKLTG